MRRPEPRARATTVLSCRAQHAQTSTAPSRLFSRRRPWRSSAARSESHWPPPGVGPEGRWGRSPSARSATGPSVLRFPPPAGRTGCSPAGLLCLIAVAAENLEAGLGSSQVNAFLCGLAKSSQLLPLLKFPLHILRGGKKKKEEFGYGPKRTRSLQNDFSWMNTEAFPSHTGEQTQMVDRYV